MITVFTDRVRLRTAIGTIAAIRDDDVAEGLWDTGARCPVPLSWLTLEAPFEAAAGASDADRALRGGRTPDPLSVTRCRMCGHEFTPARSDARYCSNRCRQAAYRDRSGTRR